MRTVLLNALAASDWLPRQLRPTIYRLLGIDVGEGVNLLAGIKFRPGWVSIGARSFVNRGVSFDPGAARIVLGRHVVVAEGVIFAAAGHQIGSAERRAVGQTAEDVVVGDGCWIGARAVILPGVTIAPGCVIGAGAVVVRDTKPNGVYAGVPAQRLRDLD